MRLRLPLAGRRAGKPEPPPPPPGRLVPAALHAAARALGRPRPGLKRWRGERFEAFLYVGRPLVYAGRVASGSEITAAHYVSWCGRGYRIPATLHVRVLDEEWLKRRLAKLTLGRVEEAVARLSPDLAVAARLAWDAEHPTFKVVDSTLTLGGEPYADTCGLRLSLVSLYPAVYAAFDLSPHLKRKGGGGGAGKPTR